MELIDKTALVAEIKRRINGINLDTIEDWRYRLQWEHDIEVMKNILSFINTLEVKEVDNDCTKLDRHDTISPRGGGPSPDDTISVVDYNGEKWVRVQAMGEDFMIATKDLDDNKEFTYDGAMEKLKNLGLNTFNRKQGFIIAIYINEINAKLSEIGGDPMDRYAYVSNELFNADNNWYFNGGNWYLTYNSRIYSHFRCRPCISYSNLKN